MKTNYKFWYIKRDDDIHIDEVAVRFFEGDIITQEERIFNEVIKEFIFKMVTKYKMFRRLQILDLPHEAGRELKNDSGGDCLIYTFKDFGITSDLDDVRVFLNGILNKDKMRDPENAQKETDKVKLKLQINK